MLSGRTTLLLLCCVMVAFVMLPAQGSAQDTNPPKWDWFLGYQWANPGATVPVQGKLPSIGKGFGTALTYNFDKNWGLETDIGSGYSNKIDENTLSIGPRFMWRTEGMNMFVHALGGLNRVNPKALASNNGVGAVLGGGMDMPLWKRVSWRVFEADYVVSHHNFFGFAPGAPASVQRPNFNGARLRSGLVFNFGVEEPVPPAASCSTHPSEVMVGEPVTVTATPSNFKKDHALSYNWASTGGKVSSKEGTATVDTAGLSGGSYTATARVSDPKVKKGGEASCSASFAVKEPPKNPPVLSLSASPTTLQVGDPATITSDCKSPDSIPVTVGGWTASSGHLSGAGNTATLDTAGASAGPISISATCTDSRGLTANASTSVTAENPPPPPPPPPTASKLSECAYPNPVKPWRVDNTCKAVLDDVALRLQRDADAKLVVVGFADDKEAKKRKNLAAERALNAKAYLSGGEAKQGIDPTRIETRTGTGGGQKSEFWVVPAGANFSGEGTTLVDEKKVKPVPDHPHAAAKPAKKSQ